MTQTVPLPPLSDAIAVAAFGRDAIDATVVDDTATLLREAPFDDFVAALDALDRAMQATDPKRVRRSVGWWGRLLGADVQAQAEADALHARMDWLLAAANDQADRMQAFAARLASIETRMDADLARLDAVIDAGERAVPPAAGMSPDGEAARFRRRLSQLSTVAAAHRITRQQLQLSRTQCERLLERHAGLRDVLRPVWRQSTIGTPRP